MNAKLSEAIEAVRALPEDRQAKIAQDMLDAAFLAELDAKIEEGERSYREDGGIPAGEFFDRLIAKYGG
ncbi:MAG: hypothetical protein AAFN79_06255 [Pseudomonadota bacterium]